MQFRVEKSPLLSTIGQIKVGQVFKGTVSGKYYMKCEATDTLTVTCSPGYLPIIDMEGKLYQSHKDNECEVFPNSYLTIK